MVVQMQAYDDMDSETFWPSFWHLFCIYFSKFLAPLLHLNFDAKIALFCLTLGSFLVPFWRHGVLRDAFGPMDAKTEACVEPVGSILEPLGGLWAALGLPLNSLWDALASICDTLLPKMAPK